MLKKFKYLRGPVTSRRLGKSLGIDLLPRNICSENCVYCECGKTEELTVSRKEYVPTQEVLEELRQRLKVKPGCDYITFSGRGEPTLHSGIGEIISFLAKDYPEYDIALLTNSTLLHNKSVQEDIRKVDLVVPSLDASTEKIFQEICRPAGEVDLKKLKQGIIEFNQKFSGKIFLEILLLKGINDSKKEIEGYKKIINKIEPDRVDLNTLNRPPAKKTGVKKISRGKMEEIAKELPGNIRIWR